MYDKRRESNLSKYGVAETMMVKEIKDKKIRTCNERYGGNSPMHSEEVRNKQKKALLDKYGVENPSKIESSQEKKAYSKYINGTCNTSKEQIRLSKLFNGTLNYPVGKYNVDILIEDNLILEYDGDGHEILVKFNIETIDEFAEKEKHRTEYLVNKGYNIIRFINKKWWHEISDDKYKSTFEKCKTYLIDHKVVGYDFNEDKIIIY